MNEKSFLNTKNMNTKTIDKNFRTDNPTFLMYKEWEDMADALDSMEEVGRLFKALFAYASRGEQPDFSGALKIAFLCISKQIDRDGEKWEEMCEKNRNNAKAKRLKHRLVDSSDESANESQTQPPSATVSDRNPPQATAYDRQPTLAKPTQTQPSQATSNHKEEDKEEVKEKDKVNVEEEDKDKVEVKVKVNVEEEEKEKERVYGRHKLTLLTDAEYELLLSMSSSVVLKKYINKYDKWLYINNKRPSNAYEAINEWIEQDKAGREKASYDLSEWEKMAMGIDPNKIGFGDDY